MFQFVATLEGMRIWSSVAAVWQMDTHWQKKGTIWEGKVWDSEKKEIQEQDLPLVTHGWSACQPFSPLQGWLAY